MQRKPKEFLYYQSRHGSNPLKKSFWEYNKGETTTSVENNGPA